MKIRFGIRVLAKDDEFFAGSADYYRASAGLAIRF